MTEQLARPIPAPPRRSTVPPPALRAPADRRGTPVPAGTCTAPATAPPYDRDRWGQALLDVRLPHHAARLLGWGLAHLAGESGYLPPDAGRVERLCRRLHMSGKQVRLSLLQLEKAGLITRPDLDTWQPKELVRPIRLTIPEAATATPRRHEPPSPGGAGA